MDDELCFENLSAAAKTLYSSVYLEPSAFPHRIDKLFSGSEMAEHLNVCIHKSDGVNAYASGYLSAAKLLARIVIYSGHGLDTVVYPIVYLYRHFTEIQLKKLIEQGAHIRGESISNKLEKVLNGHNLMQLWNGFKPFLEDVAGAENGFEDTMTGMESLINQLHEVDPGSLAFRYGHSNKSGAHSLERVENFNLLHFCQNMEKCTEALEVLGLYFDSVCDVAQEMRERAGRYVVD
ncbi:MAG: hypothetical protein ACJAXQ_000240 [Parvibaculaceae bacterium]|jgi:hypothetical protein|nr:hypothetical protein [Parvibaculaceae bacterium]